MSFTLELMPLVSYLLAVIGLGAVTLTLAAAATAVPAVRRAHATRVARQQSIPAFYRHALTH
jgi:hypothetical protein